VLPVSYSMPNVETGRFTYYDDGYAGPAATGDPTSALSPLAGGLGDLTDGTIATANWNVTPALYVGWSSITPTITFFFDQVYDFTALTLYADDSNQLGGVSTPGRAIVNGTSYQVADGASGDPIVSMFVSVRSPCTAGHRGTSVVSTMGGGHSAGSHRRWRDGTSGSGRTRRSARSAIRRGRRACRWRRSRGGMRSMPT
jgi:hypothetical protein